MATNEKIGFRIEGEDRLSPTLVKVDKQLAKSTNNLEKYEKQATKSFNKVRKEADKVKVPEMSAKTAMGNFRGTSISGFDSPQDNSPVRNPKKLSGRALGQGFSALRGNAKGFLGLGAQMGGAGIAIGAASAAVVGLGQHIAEVTEKMQQNKRIMETTFSGSPQQIEKMTVQATALSKVFGDDYNATVQAASQLNRQFGLSGDAAFELLKKGVLSGANISGDMLQQLEQFGSEMSKLGLNASEQLALIQQSAKFGGTETLVKSLQGFKEELSDFGTGTTALLNDAFGKDFTTKFRKNVQSGKIGMQEALGTISKAFNKTTLSGKDLDAAMQDTFGDAGSDLGIGAIKNLQTLNLNLDEAVSKNAEFNKGLKEQMTLDEQLATSQAKLAENFKGFGQSLSNLWTSVKTGFYDAINSMADFAQNDTFKSLMFGSQHLAIEKFAKDTRQNVSQFQDAFNKMADSQGEDVALQEIEKNLGGLSAGAKKLLLSELKRTRKVSTTDLTTLETPTGKETDNSPFFDKGKGSKSLESGISSVVGGGKEMRNVTVTINKLVGIEQLISSVKEAPPDIQRLVLDELMRVIQNAELMLAK